MARRNDQGKHSANPDSAAHVRPLDAERYLNSIPLIPSAAPPRAA